MTRPCVHVTTFRYVYILVEVDNIGRFIGLYKVTHSLSIIKAFLYGYYPYTWKRLEMLVYDRMIDTSFGVTEANINLFSDGETCEEDSKEWKHREEHERRMFWIIKVRILETYQVRVVRNPLLLYKTYSAINMYGPYSLPNI